MENDLALATVQYLVAVSFLQSRSWAYAPAVEVARQAARYDELIIGSSLIHCALFGRSRDEAARAHSVLRYVQKFRGTQVYAGGQMVQNIHTVTRILQCYLNSCACSDPAAYCSFVFQGYIIPCRQLDQGWIIFDSRIPATPAAQVEAAAVRRGVNWCPVFQVQNVHQITSHEK
jgi:hypothetical protein